jgi:Protein of unknown function (DUF4236)
MAFRFRKSLGFGFGRVNLSKRGASLSVGGPGNIVTLGRRGARTTVGIPGTGMSWSTKLGGGRRRARAYSNDEMGDTMERVDADLALAEAQYHAAELAFAKAEGLAPHMDEDQLAQNEIWRATLAQKRIEIDQTRRMQRRVKAQQIWSTTKSAIKTLLLLAILYWVFTTFAHAQGFATKSFYNANGSFAGSSIMRGNSSSFYDGQGRFSGSSIRHGNSTSFYDGSGHYTGSSINTSPRR